MSVYATFARSKEILDAMKAAGIHRAIVTLVGWNLGGHDGAYPQKLPVETALGGEAGLRRLSPNAKGMGYQTVPHDNLTDMCMAGQTYDPEAILRHADGTGRPAGRPRVRPRLRVHPSRSAISRNALRTTSRSAA